MVPNSENQLINELRSTLSKMELSLGAISDALVWIDELGIVQWCNTKFDQLINRPHIEILSNPIYELISFKKNGKPISWKNIFLNSVKDKSKAVPDIYELEINNQHLLLEIESNQFQFYHQMSIVAVLHNVTERELAQEKIKFLASYPENSPAPIFSINKNMEIIYSNQPGATLLEHLEREHGKTFSSNFVTLIKKSFETQQEYLIEEICNQKIYLFMITPGATSDYINIYAANITKRKKAEDALMYLCLIMSANQIT